MQDAKTYEYVKEAPPEPVKDEREFLQVIADLHKNPPGAPLRLQPIAGTTDTADALAERLRAEIAQFYPQSVVVRVKDGVVSVTRYVGASARRERKPKGGA